MDNNLLNKTQRDLILTRDDVIQKRHTIVTSVPSPDNIAKFDSLTKRLNNINQRLGI